MPEQADKAIREILGRSLIVAETMAADERNAILRILAGAWDRKFDTGSIDAKVFRLVDAHNKIWAEHFLQTDLAAWLAAYEWTAKKLPAFTRDDLAEAPERRDKPIESPAFKMPGMFGDAPEAIRFPIIEHAAESLMERNILTRDEFDAASDIARENAFTIAGNLTTDTVEHVRDTLAETLDKGTSFRTFREMVDEKLGSSPIGSGHLENVYRTNVQAAFRDGRETLLVNPVVSDVFPYQAYLPIRDGRVRKAHLALESLGLSGTGIYRRDDPFWDLFTPPWDYQCRCGTNPMTLEQAAALGVSEAITWLETGRPPDAPEYRLQDVLQHVQPNPGFGSRGRLARAA